MSSAELPNTTTSNVSINETTSINEPSVVNINQGATIQAEKSTFERAIIEAFKQTNGDEIIQKLSIALDEVKYLIDEVKKSKGAKYVLNKNLLDKLSRITERKYFNVNILIAKIYESLLDASNFEILSNDLNLLILFSNEILNILDIVQSTNISRNLEKKCSCFLNYMLDNNQIKLEDEQKDTIQELLNSFPTRNTSESYQNFVTTKDKIVELCKRNLLDSKLEGIIMLMESFGNTYSLDEQFDLLLEFCPNIIKAVIYQPNPEFQRLYFQLGNFIISMLYGYKFKINAKPLPKNKKKLIDARIRTYYIIEDSNIKQENITENNFDNMKFLDEAEFELTTQKEILLKCENIFSICNLIINTLSIYEKNFDLQFVCYLILKKLYFTFPQFRKNIEDILAVILTNICTFKEDIERSTSIECRQFLHYLLKESDNEELKTKIQHRIDSKKDVDISLGVNKSYDQKEIEFDTINFNEFNLRVGYPNYYVVDAGVIFEKYIEIEHPNSLIYVGFATQAYDINFKIMKYTQPKTEGENKNKSFVEVFKLDKINCSEIPIKIVLLVKSPGIFKAVFDNTYSWINSKTIRYRLSVLRPLSEIDYSKANPQNAEVTLIKKDEKKTEEQKVEEKTINDIKIEIKKEEEDKKDEEKAEPQKINEQDINQLKVEIQNSA